MEHLLQNAILMDATIILHHPVIPTAVFVIRIIVEIVVVILIGMPLSVWLVLKRPFIVNNSFDTAPRETKIPWGFLLPAAPHPALRATFPRGGRFAGGRWPPLRGDSGYFGIVMVRTILSSVSLRSEMAEMPFFWKVWRVWVRLLRKAPIFGLGGAGVFADRRVSI